ncbi:MAG: nitroreductase family deazaflavin-dependent oxidoreductase [Alphaproteobacteria bacterium]
MAAAPWLRSGTMFPARMRARGTDMEIKSSGCLASAAGNSGSNWASIRDIADRKVLYLTTIGRRTGLPREIEIWFVVCRDRFYLFAETGEAAAWVKNIRSNPEVTVRIGERQSGAMARVLDRNADRELWDRVAAIADQKYGWGDGLPVEFTPFRSGARSSDRTIKPAGDH